MDTQPHPTAAADAAGHPAPAGDLLTAVERIIDGFVWQPAGPRVAALAVLGQPAITHALAAADAVADLDARHQPVPWGHGSDVVVCSCGRGAFDACDVRAVLDRMNAR